MCEQGAGKLVGLVCSWEKTLKEWEDLKCRNNHAIRRSSQDNKIFSDSIVMVIRFLFVLQEVAILCWGNKAYVS